MISGCKTIANKIAGKLGIDITGENDPVARFHSDHYLRHNARRLEHLASLRIPVTGMSVLEVGAGIGDHSHYYIDRGCAITITEARADNLQHLRKRYPTCDIQFLDMENPTPISGAPFDIVHCYGLLYHLSNPEKALEFLSQSTKKMLLLETSVSFGDEEEIHLKSEKQHNPTQAYSGTGCRPTRRWIFEQLRRHFESVYLPKTQPNHEEFPLDWATPDTHQASYRRAIFVASREKLENDMLIPSLMGKQIRHQ